MKNKLRFILDEKAKGNYIGIPSFCTANRLALKSCFLYAKMHEKIILVEATSNQVNQNGGYTGMKPIDYVEFVESIAKEVDFPIDKVILGGDHLGPLVWSDLDEEEAMKNAEVLVAQYVKAGYTKIHLDTSMKLGSDDPEKPLSDEIIASRGARLMKVCQNAFKEYQEQHPDAEEPVYIIGSEVPIPGGAEENDEVIKVTTPEDLRTTYQVYQQVFSDYELEDSFSSIIGIVVQPGVEFSDSDAHVYVREEASALEKTIKEIPNLVLEGHSTDYQPRWALKQMVEDGISILKVGPALTFAIRAGLFALSNIEEIIVKEDKSNLVETFDKLMKENPKQWKKHYHGSDEEIELKKHYSYSDRIRYYMAEEEVVQATDKLFKNIDANIENIPYGLIHQYMPEQYFKIRDSKLDFNAEALVLDWVTMFIEDYYLACE